MKEFAKRFVPFLLTFAAGLVVASFFVAVGTPGFKFNRESRHQKSRYLKTENERLRKENERLKRELADKALNEPEFNILLEVPPPPMPPMPPPPPKPPFAPRLQK